MATQLRSDNYPVGLGEGILVAWTCISWVTIIRRKSIGITSDLKPFVLFFAVVIVLFLLSSLHAVGRSGDLIATAAHDTVAYIFVAFLVLTFSLLRPSRDYLTQSLKLITVTLTMLLGVLLVISNFTLTLGPIQLHTGFRFLGLARNPNQIGMAMVPIPFLCLLFAHEATTGLRRLGYASLLILALWIGISTASDALWLSWLVGTFMFALLVLMVRVSGRVHSALPLGNVFAVCILGVLILAATPLGAVIFERLAAGDGGGHRTDIWSQALVTTLESPIFGRGPGADDLIASVGGASREAHNSYLDLALATGLLGLTAAILLNGSLIVRPSLLARPLLWSTFMALQCFIMFHYMFRHPLFWFYVILMTSLACRDYEIRLQRRLSHASGQARLLLRRA
jgi:O-antigen ligase